MLFRSLCNVLGHRSSRVPLRKKSKLAASTVWKDGNINIALAGPAEFATAQRVTTITARVIFRPIPIFVVNMAQNSGDLYSILVY